jgi:hypothetical protein
MRRHTQTTEAHRFNTVTFCLRKQLLWPDGICVKVQCVQGGEGAERSDKLVNDKWITI